MTSPLVTKLLREARRDARFAAVSDAEKQALESPGGVGIATQAEAEAGTDNAKMMTALRVAQAIAVMAEGGMTGPQIIAAIDAQIGTTWKGGGGGGSTPLVDTLVSTATDSALTANMGRALKVLIDALTAQKGANSGLASLGSDGKLTASQIPAELTGVVKYINSWNATTNSPTIPAAAAGNAGNYYIVGTAGATNVGGITDWAVGDWVISNGAAWTKVDNTDAYTAQAVRDVLLTGFSTASSQPVVSTDSLIVMAGKLQAQINLRAMQADLSSYVPQGWIDAPGGVASKTLVDSKAPLATAPDAVATTTYTLVNADMGKNKVFTHASGCSITVAEGLITGFNVALSRAVGAGNLTLVEGSTVAVESPSDSLILSTAKATIVLTQIATNTYLASGPLGSAGTSLSKASQAEAEAGTDDDKYMTALKVKQSIAVNGAAGGSSGLPYGWVTGFFNDLQYVNANMDGLVQTALSGGTFNGPYPANLILGRDGIARVDGASGQTNTGGYLRSTPVRVRVGEGFAGGIHYDPTLIANNVSATNVAGRMGLLGNITAAAATYGIGFEKIDHGIKAFVRNAGTTQNTEGATTYTVAAAGVFHHRIDGVDSTHIRFRIYADGNATAVFDETLTTSANWNGLIDNEDLYPAIGAWTGASATTGTVLAIANLDYIGWGNVTKNPGRPF